MYAKTWLSIMIISDLHLEAYLGLLCFCVPVVYSFGLTCLRRTYVCVVCFCLYFYGCLWRNRCMMMIKKTTKRYPFSVCCEKFRISVIKLNIQSFSDNTSVWWQTDRHTDKLTQYLPTVDADAYHAWFMSDTWQKIRSCGAALVMFRKWRLLANTNVWMNSTTTVWLTFVTAMGSRFASQRQDHRATMIN